MSPVPAKGKIKDIYKSGKGTTITVASLFCGALYLLQGLPITAYCKLRQHYKPHPFLSHDRDSNRNKKYLMTNHTGIICKTRVNTYMRLFIVGEMWVVKYGKPTHWEPGLENKSKTENVCVRLGCTPACCPL